MPRNCGVDVDGSAIGFDCFVELAVICQRDAENDLAFDELWV